MICFLLNAILSVILSIQTVQDVPLFVNVFPDNQSIYVTWNQVEGADAYRLKWMETTESTWNQVDVSGMQWSSTITNLNNGYSYYFQLEALNGSVVIEESQVVSQTPRSRESDGGVVHTSWIRLNDYITTQVTPPLDLNQIKCRGKIVPWDIQTSDCIFDSNGYQLFLVRGAGSVFDPPQDSRDPEAIRKLAIHGIWRNNNPFDTPSAFPITVTEIFTPATGLVEHYSSIKRYEIRFHPQLASRVTWFTPEVPIAGRYAIYHEGHCNYCASAMDEPTGAETINWLLSQGWQVVAMDMPLWGQNSSDGQVYKQWVNTQRGITTENINRDVLGQPLLTTRQNSFFDSPEPLLRNHNDLIYLDDGVNSPLQFFFLPVKTVVDMFMSDSTLVDPTILLIGRSGGGWTTYFYSPLDPRIDFAVSVAGGLPLSLRTNYGWRDMGDYEQLSSDLGVITHEDLMKSSGSQGALFIYNQHDGCCHTFDPDDPNYAAFKTYLESQSLPLNKQLEVFIDTENRIHSIGRQGYEKLGEFLRMDTAPIYMSIRTPSVEGVITGPVQTEIGLQTAFTVNVAPLSVNQPLTYTWHATEQASVTQTNGLSDTVLFTWSVPGTKTLEITAMNSVGIITSSYEIEVISPITGIRVDGPQIVKTSESVPFTASVSPLDVTQPVTYIWSADAHNAITQTGGLQDTAFFSWSTPGPKLIYLTVVNRVNEISTSYRIDVQSPITNVVIDGIQNVKTNESVPFTASVSPLDVTQPVTYIWRTDEHNVVTQTGGLQDTAFFSWSTPGPKQIEVYAYNNVSSLAATYTVTVNRAISQVVFSDMLSAYVNENIVLTATVLPLDAHSLITYVWEFDEQPMVTHTSATSDTVTLLWSKPGLKKGVVTATNAVSFVTQDITVDIRYHYLYFPLVISSDSYHVVYLPFVTLSQ